MLAVTVALSAVAALATGLLSPSSVFGLAGIAGTEHNHGAPPPVAAPTPAPAPSTNNLPPLPSIGSNDGSARAFAPASPSEDFSLLEVYARKAQDIDHLFVTARMHEPGNVAMSATVNVSDGTAGASAKPPLLQFAQLARRLPAHLKAKLPLKLGRSDLAKAKRALRQGKGLVVKVTVNGRGASGKQTTAVRTIRLRFEGIGGLRAEVAQILTFLKALVGGDTFKRLSTATGTPGAQGPQGDPGRSALSELQPGETERGTVGGEAAAVDTNTEVTVSATLPVPAAFGLDDDHVVVDGNPEDETADQCKGTADDPQADPGYVCIYSFSGFNDNNTNARGFIWGSSQDEKAKWGFQVSWYPTSVPPANTAFFGNWAYTAPGTPPVSSGHHH
jgi:hypothetical protein